MVIFLHNFFYKGIIVYLFPTFECYCFNEIFLFCYFRRLEEAKKSLHADFIVKKSICVYWGACNVLRSSLHNK